MIIMPSALYAEDSPTDPFVPTRQSKVIMCQNIFDAIPKMQLKFNGMAKSIVKCHDDVTECRGSYNKAYSVIKAQKLTILQYKKRDIVLVQRDKLWAKKLKENSPPFGISRMGWAVITFSVGLVAGGYMTYRMVK